MRLNLGCGSKKVDGFIGVDIKHAEVVADIRRLPYAAESIEEIMAIHVVEHFYLHEIVGVLRHWHDLLVPGGMMTLELPCLDKVLQHFSAGSPENFTLWPLYGDPRTHTDGEPALHKWCWSKAQFRQVLEMSGFTDITEEVPRFHQPSRDMRFTCKKGSPK